MEINQNDLEDNIDELLQLCHLKFMDGKYSSYFNYEVIDNDQELDDVQQIDQQKEQEYFEEEDEHQIGECTDTGIQDY